MENMTRDWLSENIQFIETGLRLIKKEFYLPDNIGSKGFIDLLCVDIYNNYVIIELKRSEASARQTINEVLKYSALIKQNFKARESEIRIIIISTHWNELIRAFSEMFHKTNISIKGYKIEVNDDTGIPYSKSSIEPLSEILISRKFAYWQGLYLFKTKEKRENFVAILETILSMMSFKDFVLLSVDAPKDNEKVITPYSIIAAFQRQSIADLLKFIDLQNIPRDAMMNEDEFDDELSYQMHLEDAFIASLNVNKYDDDAETGYPEKLDSMLNVQRWKIATIRRYGIFKNDPRYSDELLIKELRGHDGNSKNKFVGFAESTQIERVKEIQKECLNCLSHTPHWFDFIYQLFETLLKSSKKYRILIDIYNPDSIVTSLYFTLTKANPNYLPKYLIFIDHLEGNETEIYVGDIYGNGKRPTSKLFTSDDRTEISNEVFRLNISPENFIDSYKIALIYTNKKIIVSNGKEIYDEFVYLTDGVLTKDYDKYADIKEYIIRNQLLLQKFIYNYSSVAGVF